MYFIQNNLKNLELFFLILDFFGKYILKSEQRYAEISNWEVQGESLIIVVFKVVSET
jgi:hypothetical protein